MIAFGLLEYSNCTLQVIENCFTITLLWSEKYFQHIWSPIIIYLSELIKGIVTYKILNYIILYILIPLSVNLKMFWLFLFFLIVKYIPFFIKFSFALIFFFYENRYFSHTKCPGYNFPSLCFSQFLAGEGGSSVCVLLLLVNE